jgi:hypothetical protein
MLACGLMVAFGILCIFQNFGNSTGSFLIGLGICAAALSYLHEKRTADKTQEKYRANLAAAYQRMHCRDHRALEIDDNGYSVSCKCGTVARPWSELVRFSENEKLFFVATKVDAQLVPKTAFPSEGGITEFRTLFLEKLNVGRSITSRHIDFSYTPQDLRNARILHLFRGGGWHNLTGKIVTSCISAFGVYTIWRYLNADLGAALFCGLIGAMLALPLVRSMRARKKRGPHYFGPQRIYFSEQGLHLQDTGTVARNTWTQFIGYLEGEHAFLLYYGPLTCRIIPRRALSGWEAEFRALLEAKLKRYNYGHPATANS